MQRDEVGLVEQLGQLRAIRRVDRAFGGAIDAFAGMVEDLHAESVGGLGSSRLADAAESDQAQRFSRNLSAEHVAGAPSDPAIRTHFALAFAGTPRNCQHEKDGELGSALRQHIGRIRDHDVLRPASRDVDVLEAHAVVADEANLAAGLLEDARAKAIRHRNQQNLVLAGGGVQFLRRQRFLQVVG